MSQIRLYFDEDTMRRSLVFAVRSRNVDVVTAFEAGMIDRPDEDHLAFASTGERALVSYNIADYCALHRRWMDIGRSHGGIVLLPQQRYSLGEELRRLMKLISARKTELMRNRLEFLSSWS